MQLFRVISRTKLVQKVVRLIYGWMPHQIPHQFFTVRHPPSKIPTFLKKQTD